MSKKEESHLVVDVTTLIKWNRPPVGIIRTELEFVNYLIDNDTTAIYFMFNDTRNELLEISRPEIEQVVLNLLNYTDSTISISKKSLTPQINIFQKILRVYRDEGTKSVLKKTCHKLCPLKLKDFLQKVYLKLFSQNEIVDESIGDKLFLPELSHSKWVNPTFLTSNSIVVSMGLDWDYSNYPLLFWLKKRIGFKFVSTFYDAIPITHPDLVASHDFAKMFFSHIYYLIHLSDKVFCISDYSKNQLTNIIEEHHIVDKPILKTIHLGDSIVTKESTDSKTTIRGHKKDNYILYVSTIEARKNHQLLLSVWQNLLKDKTLDLPDLVLVGMMGWGVDEMLNIYDHDKDLQKSVHFYHNVDDKELVSLYRDTKFTLFPSFVEGWGLGAVESMLYGKPCITSTCPALIEATQGLMPSIDAKDIKGWEEMIKLFIKEPSSLEELQDVIKKRFKSRSWREFSQDFEIFAKEEV